MSGKAWTFRKSTAAFVALLTALLAVGTGCSSVDQQPFDKFATALSTTQTGTMSCLNLAYTLSRNDFMESFAANQNAKFSSLKLVFPEGNNERPDDKKPLFVSILHARTSLQKLDTAFSSYALLLKMLAGTKPLSPDELNALSTKANNVAASAYNLSGLPAGEADKLIGAAFSKFADLYVRHRHKSYLQKAINGNRPQVKKYADLGIRFASAIKEALAKSYLQQFESLQQRWNATDKKEEKLAILSLTLDLNTRISTAMELLDISNRAYELLPQAYDDLAKSIDDNDATLTGLDGLTGISEELKIFNSNLSSLTTQNKQ